MIDKKERLVRGRRFGIKRVKPGEYVIVERGIAVGKIIHDATWNLYSVSVDGVSLANESSLWRAKQCLTLLGAKLVRQ